MTTISADPQTLMEQASMTANTYYRAAVRDLPDDVAPEVMAAYIQAASQDMAASIVAKIIEQGLSDIAENLTSIAYALAEDSE